MIRPTLLLFAALLLAACSLPFGGDRLPPPPDAAVIVEGQNADVDQVLDALDAGVRRRLTREGYDVAEAERYRAAGDVASVAAYYEGQLRENGWEQAPNALPLRPDQTVLAYRKGSTLIVVVAIDTTSYLNQGVLIYVVRGTQ